MMGAYHLLLGSSQSLISELDNLTQQELEIAFRLLWDPELEEQQWKGQMLPRNLEQLPREGWELLGLLLQSILEQSDRSLLH